jgi:CDP-diglyceride synthetase
VFDFDGTGPDAAPPAPAVRQADSPPADQTDDLSDPVGDGPVTPDDEPEDEEVAPDGWEPGAPWPPPEEVPDTETTDPYASLRELTAEEEPSDDADDAEDHTQTSTAEYDDLAAEMAAASEQDHEAMAVSADIPGLESGVVGLEDVVAATGEAGAPVEVRRGSDLPIRVLTGLGLLLVFFGSLYHPVLIGLLVVTVLGLAAGEYYTVLVRSGHHPISLFGLLGTAGALIGSWVWGPIAIPVSILGTIVFTLFFYAVVPARSHALRNTSLTVLGMVWIGGLGGFSLDLMRSEHYRWLISGIVVTTALMDVAQYAVGRRLGRRRLAPVVSPKKTVEGLVGGILAALLIGVGFGFRDPFDLGSGLLLGAIVAVVAPFGDLAVSVFKRAIGVKDMGALLPGHGGILDRVDAMIMVIPAAWVAYAWMGLLA